MRGAGALALCCLLLLACEPGDGGGAPAGGGGEEPAASGATAVRLGLFNVKELTADKLADVDAEGVGRDRQARAAATIIQRLRPDVLVINEIDFPAAEGGEAEAPDLYARRFADLYLATGEDPIQYPYAFAAPVNTGILSGLDLDGDGVAATAGDRGTRLHGNDSFGYGTYPGQYGMAVLSRHPLLAEEVRTFQRFLWRDLPGNHLPEAFYGERAVGLLRLSSKSHWDLPVSVDGRRLHLWVSHPTPPAFDGEEDRNGRRNFDEIKLWVAYLEGEPALYDDAGRGGGYASPGEPFVIAGDLNARPEAEESLYDGKAAIAQLLEQPGIQDSGPWLTSRGSLQGREPGPPTYPERSTAGFLGGVRVDYLLPSADLEITGGGVFWPSAEEDPEGHLLAQEASDHHFLWLDVVLPADREP